MIDVIEIEDKAITKNNLKLSKNQHLLVVLSNDVHVATDNIQQ